MLLFVILSLVHLQYPCMNTSTRADGCKPDTAPSRSMAQSIELVFAERPQPLPVAFTCPNHTVIVWSGDFTVPSLRCDVSVWWGKRWNLSKMRKTHQIWSSEEVPAALLSAQNASKRGYVHRGTNGHVPKAEYLDIKTILCSSSLKQWIEHE